MAKKPTTPMTQMPTKQTGAAPKAPFPMKAPKFAAGGKVAARGMGAGRSIKCKQA